jgi:hypothetical protein
MEWYEIIILIIIIPVGAYIRGEIYEFRKNYHYYDSWKSRGKDK